MRNALCAKITGFPCNFLIDYALSLDNPPCQRLMMIYQTSLESLDTNHDTMWLDTWHARVHKGFYLPVVILSLGRQHGFVDFIALFLNIPEVFKNWMNIEPCTEYHAMTSFKEYFSEFVIWLIARYYGELLLVSSRNRLALSFQIWLFSTTLMRWHSISR